MLPLLGAALIFILGTCEGATVSVNQTELSHLDWVRVSFSGIDLNETAEAWIGVFYPFDADVGPIAPLAVPYSRHPWTATMPVKYAMCSDIPECLKTGAGSFDFRLYNAFQDCKISLFVGGLDSPKAVAESERITFIDLSAPMKGHLTRTQSPEEMMVVWSTREEDADSLVEWSLSPGEPYEFSASASTKTHGPNDLCGEPASTHGYYPPFYWHYGVINGLRPGRDRVYFRYGSPLTGQWSAEESFRSAPPSSPLVTTNLILVADIGVSEFESGSLGPNDMPEAKNTWNAIANTTLNSVGTEYDLLLHVGDISYGMGYLIKWETYMSALSSLGFAEKLPYLMVQGNHERDFPDSGSGGDLYPSSSDSGGECGVPTELRFPSPTNLSTKDGGWYSIAHGPALLIMMNSEARVDPDSQQYLFLQDTLQAADRVTTPWVVVVSHRPMYYVYSKGGKIDPVFQVLEDLFVKYQVDLFVVGHVHNTYRSCPVYNGSCVEAAYQGAYDSVVHMGIGNGGVTPLDVVGNETNTPSWVAYQASEYGFCTLRIELTSLEIAYLNNQSEVHHTARLQRAYPRKYVFPFDSA